MEMLGTARVFAFLMLDCAVGVAKGEGLGSLVRVVKIGVKAAKSCLGESSEKGKAREGK